MQNDRFITISAAGSREAKFWPAQTLLLSEFYDRLRCPTRSAETQKEYDRLPKKQQDRLKDVGGFVAGELIGERRKSNTVAHRDMLTLDVDNIPPGGTDDILRRLEGLSCGYCVYSTRKHRPEAPRLRILIPLDHSVSADEYEPIARKTAELIDPSMRIFDPSTFQPSRLMYWPSVSSDGVYVYTYGDKPLLSANGVLAMYPNWRDISSWPEVPGHKQEAHQRMAARQGDPLTKKGVVGAFCRTHSITEVLTGLLPGVYLPTDRADRWTYAAGSTSGGAIIYEDKYLYSHHATDPIGGKLCNAFDLCRLHLYGAMDADAKDGTPVVKLPSYQEMIQFALRDTAVTDLLNREKMEAVKEDFGICLSEQEDGIEWARQLETNETGGYKRTIQNVCLVLEHHPALKDRIRLDTFADRIMGVAPLPWAQRKDMTGEFEWQDKDDSGLRSFIERLLGFRSKDVIDDAVQLVASIHRYNPVAAYLTGLSWDGTERLDRLYIDYLGAEDCAYIKAVTRKAFAAAVARAMEPGTKFDYMTVVCGAQGIGKSTLFAKMGKAWFTSSVSTFEGKDAAEALQCAWIVEIGELEAFNKADVRAVKQFLSRTDDRYRAAYGHRTESHLRRCVFFGTTNDREYLKDPTGNRRFWPVDCGEQPAVKQVFRDLTEDVINQLWAEAYYRWQMQEPLILSKELEEEASRRRGEHKENDDLRGVIEAFLERPVPVDWQKWDAKRRELFLGGNMRGEIATAPRDRICAMEIFRECLHDYRPLIPQKDTRRINTIIASLPGWEKTGIIRFGAVYGMQRGFKRINTSQKSVNAECIQKNMDLPALYTHPSSVSASVNISVSG